jgi:hypothetical protein
MHAKILKGYPKAGYILRSIYWLVIQDVTLKTDPLARPNEEIGSVLSGMCCTIELNNRHRNYSTTISSTYFQISAIFRGYSLYLEYGDALAVVPIYQSCIKIVTVIE